MMNLPDFEGLAMFAKVSPGWSNGSARASSTGLRGNWR
jgi:hypothetical protein